MPGPRPNVTLQKLGLLFAVSSSCATFSSVAQAEPDDAAVEARLQDLTRKFDAAERGSRLWYSGWSAFFLTATAGQAAFAVDTDDRELRVTYAVGAATSAVGLVTTVFLPPADAFAPSRLRAMPETTPEERRKKLDEAERALEHARDEQKLGQSWLAHAGGVVVNGAAGLVLWKGYDYGSRGLSAFLVGIAVSEIKIFTQPTWALDERPQTQVTLAAWPGGAAVKGTF